MESRLKLLGHPVHPMLVIFPLGLFVTAVVFDFADLVGGPALLGEVAYWNIVAGLIGGLLAAPAGLVDFLGIPAGTRAKRVGAMHGLVNAGVMVLFAVVWLARMGTDDHTAGGWLFVVELIALAGGGVGAWLGGELVDRLGVGVDTDAGLDAPASLETGLVTRSRPVAR
ncbi:MAG TPA: DUF2231 domain-containing protein [Pilimelia sp.]|nr:DUF2231 domain-containing protein [Pilimelia sp.]